MTDEDLTQLEAVLAEAEQGPWTAIPSTTFGQVKGPGASYFWIGASGDLRAVDARAIAAARNAVEPLIAEVRRHRAAQASKAKSGATSPQPTATKRRRSGGASS